MKTVFAIKPRGLRNNLSYLLMINCTSTREKRIFGHELRNKKKASELGVFEGLVG